MALNRVLLVRHDFTRSNTVGYLQGQTDPGLERGYKTRVDALTDIIAQEERQYLQEVPLYIISSDLGRTYGTAERMHHRLWDKHRRLAELFYTRDLKERGLGDLQELSFEEALHRLSSDPALTPDAKTIYNLLYSSNKIPNGETHEELTARLERFARDYVQQLNGVGIVVTHIISGMNNLQNLLTDGNILANSYQHYPNLSVVRLQSNPKQFMRYTQTGIYGPPDINGVGVDNTSLVKKI